MVMLEIVKNTVDKVYPKIKADYGLSRYNDFPKVEIHRNIYEMLSGIEGMEGEDNAQANYCRHSNTIELFYSEIRKGNAIVWGMFAMFTLVFMILLGLEKAD